MTPIRRLSRVIAAVFPLALLAISSARADNNFYNRFQVDNALNVTGSRLGLTPGAAFDEAAGFAGASQGFVGRTGVNTPSLVSAPQGSIPVFGPSGAPATIGPCPAGQVIGGQGAGANPVCRPQGWCAPVETLGIFTFNSAATNSAAFSSWAAALGASGCIVLGPGVYNVNAPVAWTVSGSTHISVIGAGADVTVLVFPSSTDGIAPTMNSVGSSFSVRDMTIAKNGVGGVGFGLNCRGTSILSTNAVSDITNVMFRGSDGYNVTNYWSGNIQLNVCPNVNIIGGTIVGAAGSIASGTAIGLNVLGQPGGSNYTYNTNINGLWIVNMTNGIVLNSWWQGLMATNMNIVGCANGINQVASASGILSTLQVTNSQIACQVSGSVISSPIIFTEFSNNSVQAAVAGANGLNFGQTADTTLSNNILQGNLGGGFGIAVANTAANTAFKASGNTVKGYTTGLVLTASAQNVDYSGNPTINNATAIANSATANIRIKDNMGYNPVGPSSLSPGASPWTYTAGASPETLILSASTSITSITQNGVSVLPASLGANVPITLNANPNDVFVITYTGTLSAKRVIN